MNPDLTIVIEGHADERGAVVVELVVGHRAEQRGRAEQEELERSLLGSAEVGELERQGEEEEENTISH